MGAQLAAEALRRGHRVTVVHGPSLEPLPKGCRRISVERTAEMDAQLRKQLPSADALIMAAAVADFKLASRLTKKLPRKARLLLKLNATQDIVAALPRRCGQIFAGFALEPRDAVSRAMRKLKDKRLDLVLAQRAAKESPFGRKKVRAWLLGVDRQLKVDRRRNLVEVADLGWTTKPRIARLLLDKIEALWYGQRK